MRTGFDLTPVYRSMIGADHLAQMIDSAMRSGARDDPPYDIEKTGEQAYRITLATPGFRQDELEITAQPNLLVVSGRKSDRDDGQTWLHRGLAQRGFEQRFELADHVVVCAARYIDGLLTIDLVREVPEALKPRRIEIGGSSPLDSLSKLIDRRRKTSAKAA